MSTEDDRLLDEPQARSDSPRAGGSESRGFISVEYIACAESSRRLFELARRVAASDCTVLIGGESGCGKEVLARFIHASSTRAAAPFVAVNCAAIPENMLEALLFGHERGAFTGAHAAHAGKFEQAQNGTLLLDEVTEMSLPLQAKLLRVLQEREVERLGGRTPVALNVRVLATTNRQLRTEVAHGRFREDLYYRLNVFPLVVSPLRQRQEDILPLAMQRLAHHCRGGQRIPALSAQAAHKLLTHTWPGNVRELDNVMQRALILVNGSVIEPEQVQTEEAVGGSRLAVGDSNPPPVAGEGRVGAEGVGTAAASVPLAQSLSHTERDVILHALRSDCGNRRATAERLGISERTLRYKLARLREAGVTV